MEFYREIKLKDGRTCVLRNGTAQDAPAVLAVFNLTHEQTDYLLTYPEETGFTEEQEAQFLQEKAESPREIEILAEIGGRLVGTAGVESMGSREKIRHRAEFGLSVDQEFWGLGIGRALTKACIECAQQAGYSQLELTVVAENERAMALYRSEGFAEYGRNPKGFRSRLTGWQEIVLMRRELSE